MTKPQVLLQVQGVSRSFGGLKAVQGTSVCLCLKDRSLL